jgi:hypothetical protein
MKERKTSRAQELEGEVNKSRRAEVLDKVVVVATRKSSVANVVEN